MHKKFLIIASEAVDQLLSNGDYIGAVKQIYVEVMGPYVFYGILLLSVFGAYYIRKQSIIPVIIISILLFGMLIDTIPTPLIGLSLIIMALGIAGLLYLLFMRERV